MPLLRSMWLIRAFEEKASELYARREISGLLHLSIGQEAVAVGVCSELGRDDYLFSGHRAHGHAIAKGADLNKLMAELAGRATGYCRGKGGSMHIVASDAGFVTATGIVGGSIPLALGAALVCKERNNGRLAVVFFGDGAGQAGPFHESLNIASLWKLPVIFVCENNGYAEFTPLSSHTLVERLAGHARTYSMPDVTVDGNDLLAVRSAVETAVRRARSGGGPTFVECLTYRLRGHYEGDPGKYRELSELADWKSKDPIARFVAYLKRKKLVSDKQVKRVEAEARATVEKAAAFALSSPWPAREELSTEVFA
ncbi:MAG: thiamine pyrophosphate-dependent dehydrogenase E1 component subunit alpha [Candidatus Binatia bacterium]